MAGLMKRKNSVTNAVSAMGLVGFTTDDTPCNMGGQKSILSFW
jgi:hypothetical protein